MSQRYPDLDLTTIPNSIQTFTNMLNITAQDGPLVLQYLDAMNSGNTALASQILSQIPSGSQKIIKATDLNTMTQCIQALERLFMEDFEDWVNEQQQSWINIINQFSYIGNWNNGTAYVRNNMVTYYVEGITLLYVATVNNVPVGTPPTNTQYWRQLSIVGLQGPAGPGLTFSQAWDSSTVYPENSAVVYGGALWYALQENTNVQPGTDSEIWVNFLDLSTTVYPIQDSEPVSAVQGGLWFNTQNNPTGYVRLEPLDNPATSAQILSTYEAYNDQGEVIEGTLDVYTKPEIDEKLANYLPLAGGTMTGNINSSEGQTFVVGIDQDRGIEVTTNQTYVGTNGANILFGNNVVSVQGTLQMNNQKVTQVATPVNDTDAANKAYVDANSGGVPGPSGSNIILPSGAYLLGPTINISQSSSVDITYNMSTSYYPYIIFVIVTNLTATGEGSLVIGSRQVSPSTVIGVSVNQTVNNINAFAICQMEGYYINTTGQTDIIWSNSGNFTIKRNLTNSPSLLTYATPSGAKTFSFNITLYGLGQFPIPT